MHFAQPSEVMWRETNRISAAQKINLDTEVAIQNATCENTPDGSISLSPQTGIGPYTYQWSIPGSMNLQTGLLPGTYFVTVTDNTGTTEEIE